jgi:hypothetical protein
VKAAEGGEESAPNKAKDDGASCSSAEADARLLSGMGSAGAPGSKAAETLAWGRAKVRRTLAGRSNPLIPPLQASLAQAAKLPSTELGVGAGHPWLGQMMQC